MKNKLIPVYLNFTTFTQVKKWQTDLFYRGNVKKAHAAAMEKTATKTWK